VTAAKVYDLRGQRALVTGAGRGIGEACAKTLAAAGAEVVLTARTEKQLEQVRDEIIKSGGKASVHAADICSMEAVNNLKKLGPFNILTFRNTSVKSLKRGSTKSWTLMSNQPFLLLRLWQEVWLSLESEDP